MSGNVFISYPDYDMHVDDEYDYEVEFDMFLDELWGFCQNKWDWFTGDNYVMVDQSRDTTHEFRGRTALEFVQNSFFRFRNETHVNIFNDNDKESLSLSYVVYNGSSHRPALIYPQAWFVRDLLTMRFIDKKRIGDREFYGDYFGKIAYWTDLHDAESDINNLFDPRREYQIELMNSGYIMKGVMYF